jgi:CMP/dCMP kinase
MTNQTYVITISHQLGSGGATLGKQLSERLGIPFIDREILKRIAKQLQMTEEVLERREERLSSFWDSLARVAILSNPVECMSLDIYEPTDRELFMLESENIGKIAEKSSAIFLGRCGRYILRDHPRHFSILVHANAPSRMSRIQDLFCLNPQEARKALEEDDRARGAYIQAFTRQNWLDARLYDLCLNTTSVGMDAALEIVLSSVGAKMGLALPS